MAAKIRFFWYLLPMNVSACLLRQDNTTVLLICTCVSVGQVFAYVCVCAELDSDFMLDTFLNIYLHV